MVPTLAVMPAMAAIKFASTPGLFSLRTRTVRIILRSHAIVVFLSVCHSPPGCRGKSRLIRGCLASLKTTNPCTLYIFDCQFQFVEGFDRDAIGLGEESQRVVEDGRQSGAARADHICEIIIPH